MSGMSLLQTFMSGMVDDCVVDVCVVDVVICQIKIDWIEIM